MSRMHRWTPCLLAFTLAIATLSSGRAQESKVALPSDTQALVRINFQALINSPLAKNLGIDQAKELFQGGLPGTEIFKELGFDPFKDLHSITIAAPGGNDNEKSLIIVAGKFNSAKLNEKAKEQAKEKKTEIKTHDVAGKVVFELKLPDQQVPLFVVIANDGAILASPEKDYLAKALGAKSSQPASKEFNTLIESLDPKLGISIGVVGSALAMKNLPDAAKDILKDVDSIGGGLGIDKDITLKLAINTKNEEAAKKIQETLNQGLTQALGFLGLMAAQQKELAPALEFVKSIKVDNKSKAVTIQGQLPGKLIEDAIKEKTK